MIGDGSSLLEVGCGTGDLLFQAAPLISSGHGVDLDRGMIEFAQSRSKELNLGHLSFECIDALQMAPRQFDISTSTLCLHELPARKACELLNVMIDLAGVALIADYTGAKTTLGKLGIEFDEMISGHYCNFRQYRKCGKIPAYAEIIGATIQSEVTSTIDGISIWRISRRTRTPT